jgi:hypothetical protein
MKRTLIALALALGATAAVADPSLNAAQNQQAAWKNAPEATAYLAQARDNGINHNPADYPFTP